MTSETKIDRVLAWARRIAGQGEWTMPGDETRYFLAVPLQSFELRAAFGQGPTRHRAS